MFMAEREKLVPLIRVSDKPSQKKTMHPLRKMQRSLQQHVLLEL